MQPDFLSNKRQILVNYIYVVCEPCEIYKPWICHSTYDPVDNHVLIPINLIIYIYPPISIQQDWLRKMFKLIHKKKRKSYRLMHAQDVKKYNNSNQDVTLPES